MKKNWKYVLIFVVINIIIVFENFIIGKRYWWNIIGSIPGYFFLLIPLCILLLLIGEKHKWIFIVSALFIAYLIVQRVDINLNQSQIKANNEPSPIKVMTWNTEFWDQNEKKDSMYSFLKNYNQDIYILQEYLYVKGDYELYAIDREDILVDWFSDYNVFPIEEFVILTKYPIVDYELSPSKQILKMNVKVGGDILTILNVHIRPHIALGNSIFSSRFWELNKEYDKIRKEGFNELKTFITSNPKGDPLIVTGDFNTTLLMGNMDWLRKELNDAAQFSKNLFLGTWYHKDFCLWRIDYFLYNDYVKIFSYDTAVNLELSDHKAQLVQIELSNKTRRDDYNE